MPLLLLAPLLLVVAAGFKRGVQVLDANAPREPVVATSTPELVAAGSTVGAAIGTLIGTIVGATGGSVIPGAGTVAGGAGGAAGGAGVGTAIGAAAASIVAFAVGGVRDNQLDLIAAYEAKRGGLGGFLLAVQVGLSDLFAEVYQRIIA